MKRLPFAVVALLLIEAGSAALAHAESAWFTDSRAAFAAARKSDKKVLVDLFAEWCGWCKVMDQKVFSTAEFNQYAEEFVLLRVDVEDGAYGSEIQKRFRANSLPTLLLLDPHEALVGSVQGFIETDRLIQRLAMEIRQYESLVARADTLASGSDLKAQEALAKELHGRGDGAHAAKLFEKLLAAGTLEGDARSWIRLQLADSYRMAARFADAEKAARTLKADLAAATSNAASASDTANAATSAKLFERVDLLLLYIAGGAHDCSDAATALAAFEKGYPKSPFLKEARRAYRSATTDSGTQCS